MDPHSRRALAHAATRHAIQAIARANPAPMPNVIVSPGLRPHMVRPPPGIQSNFLARPRPTCALGTLFAEVVVARDAFALYRARTAACVGKRSCLR